ncbi:DUF7933 domain-containing protein [Polluticaenibacter yanchengensis]|uniref:GEVED domain-containing protein n=1 Tax=Polluticaenibacter yanchengensis TaxID=3014562 RepID=A0ABT4UIZ0_9BACT|nr:GEVED domain-containing protein [Chitinophagaceae bacterium LY-5]
MKQLYRIFLFTISLFFINTFQSLAQSISNPGFETYTYCPPYYSTYDFYSVDYVTGWHTPTAATSDYLNSCGFSHNSTVGAAQSGRGYLGAFLENYGIDYKEYATNQFSTSMIAGRTYIITFWVSHLYGTNLPSFPSGATYLDLPASERGYLGLCFSTSAPTSSNAGNSGQGSIVNSFGSGRTLIPATNTTVYGSASRNTWQQVTLEYKATGGEQYMTVGQFRPGVSSIPYSSSYYQTVYYMYDNFSISVAPNPTLTKSVAPSTIINGGTATYTFTIANNSSGSIAQTGLNFTDNLPAGLRIAGTPNVVVTGLTGGTVTATAGGTSVTATGYSIAAGTTATISVNVTNASGQLNAGCSTNPAAFTNSASRIVSISSNLTNNIGNVCLSVIACPAGSNAPTLSSTGVMAHCPATGYNLNAVHSGTIPGSSSLVWFTNNTHSGTPLTAAVANNAGAGTYYAFYYNTANNCFSPASAPVTVSVASCDYGNLPVAAATVTWPQASASLLSLDLSNNGRVWLGNNTSYPNQANQANAGRNGGLFITSEEVGVTGDGSQFNPFVFEGFDWKQATINMNFNITVNGNSSPGKLVYYGVWFDANGNGVFTDADDIFVTGSKLHGSPVLFQVPFIFNNGGTNTGASSGAVRIAATAENTLFTKAQNGAVAVINGEIEDYYVSYPIVLPVNLLSFSVIQKSGTAVLSWTTGSEQNNKGFHIQKSTDGNIWNNIGYLNSKVSGGNSSSQLLYDFSDHHPVNGINYYRLNQVDVNGTSTLSRIISLNIINSESAIKLFPNPAKNIITVSGLSAKSHIRIDHYSGKTMMTLKAANGQANMDINVSLLTKGIYFMIISDSEGSTCVHKFIKD